MAKKTETKPETKKAASPHDDLAAKRVALVEELAALDEEIAALAEAARTGDV